MPSRVERGKEKYYEPNRALPNYVRAGHNVGIEAIRAGESSWQPSELRLDGNGGLFAVRVESVLDWPPDKGILGDEKRRVGVVKPRFMFIRREVVLLLQSAQSRRVGEILSARMLAHRAHEGMSRAGQRL